ncbi:MAG: 16S rRNA processing protein RimM [Chitinophagaceae bacterium]|nr:16S rRNA processing protein RimM [Chitinophagaceae bacterium]
MQLIGKIIGSHGLKGEITLSHQLKKNTSFKDWDCLMIEIHPKSYIPFFIEEIRQISDDECLCKLEEINDRESTKQITQCNAYTSINYTIQNRNIDNLKDWIGYQITDNNKLLGTIEDVIDSKWNQMFIINSNGKEILIPSTPAFIDSIDKTKQVIYMNLPEGLLDL